jgi:hypothetical protein
VAQELALCRATADAIDSDPVASHPNVVKFAGGGLTLALVIQTVLPFVVKAVEALLEQGVTQPTPEQLLQKSHELAGCR